MATLIILQGLPYSGKTTFAKKWAKAKSKRVRISWREMSSMMCNTFGREVTPLAVDATLHLMLRSLKRGFDVMLDEPNLYGPEYAVFQAKAMMAKHKVEFKRLPVDPKICKERCLALGGDSARCMDIDRKYELYGQMLEKG